MCTPKWTQGSVKKAACDRHVIKCAPAQIAVGCDADILVLSQTLELRYVYARGKLLRTPEWTLGGAFERGSRIRPRTL